MSRRRMVFASEDGTSVIELAIAAVVASIAAFMVLTLLVGAQRVHEYTNEQAASLSTLQHATERLAKELRQARIVLPESTDRSVSFWLDRDRDNFRDPAEQITWEVVTIDGRVRLQRRTGAAAEPDRVEAGISDGAVFSYYPGTNPVTIVAISLTADVRPDENNRAARHVKTEVMLRNVSD